LGRNADRGREDEDEDGGLLSTTTTSIPHSICKMQMPLSILETLKQPFLLVKYK